MAPSKSTLTVWQHWLWTGYRLMETYKLVQTFLKCFWMCRMYPTYMRNSDPTVDPELVIRSLCHMNKWKIKLWHQLLKKQQLAVTTVSSRWIACVIGCHTLSVFHIQLKCHTVAKPSIHSKEFDAEVYQKPYQPVYASQKECHQTSPRSK